MEIQIFQVSIEYQKTWEGGLMSPQSDTGCVGAVALLGVEPEALLYRRPQSSLSWRRSPDRGIASRFTQVLTALCKRLMDHMKSLITRFIKSV